MINYLINILYPITSTYYIIAYLPQLKKYIQSKDSLESSSLQTWFSWASCSSITFLYALRITGDFKFSLFSFLHAFFCFLNFFIIIYKRKKYAKKYLIK